MSNALIAAIRTAVQAGIGSLVAWAASLGVIIDQPALEAFAFSVIVGVVTLVLNKLQAEFPWLGRFLSLGLSNSGPSYR